MVQTQDQTCSQAISSLSCSLARQNLSPSHNATTSVDSKSAPKTKPKNGESVVAVGAATKHPHEATKVSFETTKSFPLLRLPLELRRQVYRNVIGFRPMAKLDGSTIYLPKLNTAILRVCRLTHQEVSELLYSTGTIKLKLWSTTNKPLKTILNCLTRASLSSDMMRFVRELQIVFLHRHWERRWPSEVVKISSMTSATVAARFQSLTQIRFELVWCAHVEAEQSDGVKRLLEPFLALSKLQRIKWTIVRYDVGPSRPRHFLESFLPEGLSDRWMRVAEGDISNDWYETVYAEFERVNYTDHDRKTDHHIQL